LHDQQAPMEPAPPVAVFSKYPEEGWVIDLGT
jgi:hypothetical protein